MRIRLSFSLGTFSIVLQRLRFLEYYIFGNTVTPVAVRLSFPEPSASIPVDYFYSRIITRSF